MKKLLLLIAFFGVTVFYAQAQTSDRAQQLEQLKQQVKPLLMQKLSLSADKAEKIVVIHFSYAGRLDRISSLQGEEKQKLTTEINEAEKKEFMAIPLNENQIKTVRQIFADNKKKQTAAN